ncbi:hypothetical protein J3R82DRAFT_602 [Butyriboletus roseoflavus]|nr:hypothetical protein J3R82DRAFT_602 [Butyriboletus roseoflavus]
MDEKALVSRRLSRKDSKNNSARSLWHRKSTKKSTESPTATATQVKHISSLASTHSLPAMDPNDDNDGPHSSQENVTSPLLSRSIIPDPLGELPAWFKKESEMAAANISTFRIKYPLHNPNGPRRYRNHHLLPPPSFNRPPSLFSPSFPPMAASVHTIQDRSEDSTRLPGPSRTPSNTPLPTPSSSQVGIPDPSVKPRSRKTSQDNVDLMDVSDPWGTHWHHQSPYDAGSSVSPVAVDSPEVNHHSRVLHLTFQLTDTKQGIPRTRSRLSSMNTGQTRRKTVTPSPLSQSTSALHLQASEPTHVTRKLSKRRKHALAGLFGTQENGTPEEPETSATGDSFSSLPKRSSTVPNGALHINFGGSKRYSALSPMTTSANGSTAALSSHSSSKQDKRTSVLGRLARKFSILRRSSQDPGAIVNEWPESTSGGVALSAVDEQSPRRSLISQRQPSPEKQATEKKVPDPSKRIPPPRIDLDMQPQGGKGPSIEVERENSDRTSSISYDVPFSPLGELTIANPDAPGSRNTTPDGTNNALPPETHRRPPPDHKCPTQDVPAAHRLHSADWQQIAKPSSVPSSAGRSSPIPGLLSPISIAVPAVTLPEVSQFKVTAQSPTPPTSIPPSSPFPGLRLSTSEVPRPIPPHLIFPAADDSPLSQASVLANPPTPYNTDELHSELPIFERVPTDRSGDDRQSQDVLFPKQVSPTKEVGDHPVDSEVRLTKSNSTTSRKTETYKLVRTHSDKVSSSSEAAFQAEGDQWLVVNSVEVPRRRRTKERAERTGRIEPSSSRTSRERERERDREKERARDRERDRERERERDRDRDRDRERGRDGERERRRRQEKAVQQDEEQRRTTSQGRVKSPSVDKTDTGSLSGRPGRARSLDTPQRPTLVQPLIFTLQDEPPRSRKSDDRPRDSVHQGHSKTARPGPSPIVTVARVDRLPSMSARPTSELTSAADMNALKAREAWEMDRLWKGRSMVQGQPETSMIASPFSVESKVVNNETARDAFSIQSFAHGSSHTSYVVQPLQAHPIPASVFYANMPSAPPPIIYAATSPYGQPHPSSSRDYTTHRSPSNSFSFPSKDSSLGPPTHPNPLPTPPRESNYQPARLPPLADRSSGSASEYWGKYANMPSHS